MTSPYVTALRCGWVTPTVSFKFLNTNKITQNKSISGKSFKFCVFRVAFPTPPPSTLILRPLNLMDINKRPRTERNERKPSIRLKMSSVDAWFPITQPRLQRHTDDTGKGSGISGSVSNSGSSWRPRRTSLSGFGLLNTPIHNVWSRLSPRLKWLVALYCCFCVCLLSVHLVSGRFLSPRGSEVMIRQARK